ncbi:isocitrate lyase [Salmonella sp. HMSC13B08]|nr:isocitrate lyase [Salmonella sp. HMSC13B08]
MKTRTQQIEELQKEWTQPRWEGIRRPYSAEEVVKLRGSVNPECTLAQLGAAKMWRLLHGDAKKGYINSLGALTGGQALQQAKAGIEAVYLSGWQVAADANLASSMYPDQSLYPANSVPAVVDRINNTFRRADQIQWASGIEPGDPRFVDYFLPIVADAEAGFGGVLNAFELMKSMIEAGAAAVHFEDQLASVKKCGHMGGKVLVPTQEAIQKLVAARLAADVMGVPTLLIARTDADAADLITSDCDAYDSEFITGERTSEGFFRTRAGIEQAISRGLAKRFADAIHAKYPGKLLAYNCSPSFNWQKNLDDKTIASFQQQLSDMGYKYQFITLAGIHSMWFNMFDLAHSYAQGEGMRHYVEKVQQPEFAAAKDGYTFVSHQQEVGTGYFDKVTTIIQGGTSSVTALTGSTEESQF